MASPVHRHLRRVLVVGAAVVVVALLATAGSVYYVWAIGAEDDWDDVDFAECLVYADRAATAYESDDVILDRYGPENVTIHDLPHVQIKAFVERDDAQRIQWITVRGTANLENARLDGDYDKVRHPILGIHLHHGFALGTRATHDAIVPDLAKDYATRITGHSLGGAIAAILAMVLDAQGYRVERCITFGQPKVTNAAGVAAARHLPLLRIVHHRDLVPLVPPISLISEQHGTFRHFGPEVLIGRSDEAFAYLPEHDAERLLVSTTWTRLGQLSINDHRIAAYRAAVEKLAEMQRARAVP